MRIWSKSELLCVLGALDDDKAADGFAAMARDPHVKIRSTTPNRARILGIYQTRHSVARPQDAPGLRTVVDALGGCRDERIELLVVSTKTRSGAVFLSLDGTVLASWGPRPESPD